MAVVPACDPLVQSYSIDIRRSRTLGAGADGTVIRAWHIKHERWDALKYIRSVDSELEVQVLKTLGSHPHVVGGAPSSQSSARGRVGVPRSILQLARIREEGIEAGRHQQRDRG